MALNSWRRLSVLTRFTILACTMTAAFALILGWRLDSQLRGIDGAAWASIGLSVITLNAALFLAAKASLNEFERHAAHSQRLAIEHHERHVSETMGCVASALGGAIEMRDKEVAGHTERVTALTLHLARQMGWSDQELQHVWHGCLLHDIGKLGIPEVILLKPAPLTDEEQKAMQRHPQLAYDMLRHVTYLEPALNIPFCHHERWDGLGYPRGLKGEEIPPPARLFSVVDVYDALTSERPYRTAWSGAYALQYIRSKAGKHFDPRVVDLFLESKTTAPAPQD